MQFQILQADNNSKFQFQELKNEIMSLKQCSGDKKSYNKKLVIHNNESSNVSEIVESPAVSVPIVPVVPLTPFKLLNEKCNETQNINKFLSFEYNRKNKKGKIHNTTSEVHGLKFLPEAIQSGWWG